MDGWHYLKPTRSDRMPSQAVVLSCNLLLAPVAGSDQVKQPTWDAGAMISWRQRGGAASCVRLQALPEARTWLSELRGLAASGTLTWVFAFSVKRLLAACGFWDQVEAGAIELRGDDCFADGSGKRKGGKKWRGYVILEDPPTILQFRFGKRSGTVKLVDFANYGLESVSQLAEDFQNQLGGDLGGIDGFPACCHTCLVHAWCMRAWLLNAWAIMRLNGLGAWQATAASQAQYTFRRRFMADDILVHHDDAAKALERDALYSGRCECAFIGNVMHQAGLSETAPPSEWKHRLCITSSPIVQYDVNSLYPFVAGQNIVPARLAWYSENPASVPKPSPDEKLLYIADVSLDTQEPLFPVRVAKSDGGAGAPFHWVGARHELRDTDNVIYPVGKFRTVLCGPELALAASVDAIKQYHRIAAYHGAPIFSYYVEFFRLLTEQAEGKMPSSIKRWIKRLLVSVFGKFAQRSKRWVRLWDEPHDEPFDHWFTWDEAAERIGQKRCIGGIVEALMIQGEHKQSCPAITAWVNSLGRVTLLKMMQLVGRNELFYYDTDSVWTSERAAAALTEAVGVHPHEFGRLKPVGSYQRVTFRGLKNYVRDGVRVCAGLPAGAMVDQEQYAHWQSQAPLEAEMNGGRTPQGHVAERSARLTNGYVHGIVQPDGRVQPYHVNWI